MRSIRVWLLLFFLVLLTAALGAVSAYVYRLTQETLAAKEASVRTLLLARYEEKRQDYLEEFDHSILRRAQILASMAQSQSGYDLHRHYYFASQMAVSTVVFGQHAFLAVPMQGVGFPVAGAECGGHMLPRRVKIELAEAVFPRYSEGHDREYFQVYNDTAQPVQHSDSLTDFVFSLSPEQKRLSLHAASYDDAEVRPGVQARRVTLKAPVASYRMHFGPPRPMPMPGPPRGSPQRGGRRENEERPPMRAMEKPGKPYFDLPAAAIYIQCARDVSGRDAALAAFKQQLEDDVSQLEQESETALASLRQRLFLLSLITFLATAVGGVWLVRLGLSPIERITHAVSQVSAKNFDLPIASSRVPVELSPIVDKLKEALESLRHAFEREKQASADMSHELRTPIAALLATTDVCLRKDRSTKEYREAVEACQDIGRQLGVLVEKLLTLARLDAGADQLRPQPVDVPELAEQCVGRIRPLAEARGLSVRLQRNGPATAHTDADKLREVVTNLLHNAVQYNRPNGRIELRVERRNGRVSLEVEDTGVGIPEHARRRLFERFYRVDPSRHSDAMHAGLGLAIVKGYVDLMGGTIEVDSVEGRGSTFRVSLPAEE